MKRVTILARDETAALIVKHIVELGGIYELHLTTEQEGASAPSTPQVAQLTPAQPTPKPAPKAVTHVKFAPISHRGRVWAPKYSKHFPNIIAWLKQQPDDKQFSRQEIGEAIGFAYRSGYGYDLFRYLVHEGYLIKMGYAPGRGGVELFKKGDKVRDFGQVQSADEPATVS